MLSGYLVEIYEHYQKSILQFFIFSKKNFKNKKCSYLYNFGRMWLVNKLVLTFSASINYAKAQFNSISLYRVIEYTTYYRQTDRQTLSSKPFFLTQGVLKCKDLLNILIVKCHEKLTPSHLW